MIKPFTILDFPNPADDDLVHTEGGRDETISAQDEVANYINLFFQLEDLATPKARLNGVIDELIAHLVGPSRSKVTTG